MQIENLPRETFTNVGPLAWKLNGPIQQTPTILNA